MPPLFSFTPSAEGRLTLLKSTQNGDHSASKCPIRGRLECESIVANHCWKRGLNCCSHNTCNPTLVIEMDGTSESLGKSPAMNPATRVHELKCIILPSGMTTQQYSPASSHGEITLRNWSASDKGTASISQHCPSTGGPSSLNTYTPFKSSTYLL